MKIRKNLGVTLVSLLIGIGLGVFLIVTMMQIFTSTQANTKLSQNLAEVNDVLRYASKTMRDVISQAGNRTPNATTGILPAYATVFTPFTGIVSGPNGNYNQSETNANDPAGVVISYFPGQTVYASAGGVDNGDKLWVKFYGNTSGSIRDCNDLYGDTANQIEVLFYSREITVSGSQKTAYYCERHNATTNYSYDTTTPRGTELIPAALFDTAWVRFGEDLTAGTYIDRWISGDQVQDRNRVYAVRVAFLVHTRDPVRSADVTQTFRVFNNVITRTSKYIYKLYMFTILLPNAQNYSIANPVTTP
jgi:hypothetical protein